MGRRRRSSRRWWSATSSSARSSRSAATSSTSSRATSSAARATSCAVAAATAWPAAGTCAPTRSASGVGRDGAFAEYVVLPMTNIWHHWPGVDPEIAAIFDPFGNAVHTALAFPILGEDVLVSGAGPIGLMATAVVRHAGARHVVRLRAERLPARARRCGWARRSPSTRRERDLARGRGRARAWSRASTSRSRCRAMPRRIRAAIGAMAHGGGIALLGIPTERDLARPQRRSSSRC